MSVMRVSFAVLLSCVLASAEAHASGPGAERCASAAEQGQLQRDQRHLLAARVSLMACVVDTCPTAVQKDCAAWLADVERMTPTVVVRARDPRGRDLIDVRVIVDDVTILERLDGGAVSIDPGPHVIRYEGPAGAKVEERILVALGEKNRLLPVEIPDAHPTTASPPPPPQATTRPEGSSASPLVFVFAGLSAVALGSFGYFELTGQKDYRDMRDGCARTHSCANGDIDDARAKFIAAGISVGIGVVALGVATWFLLSPPKRGTARVGSTF